jgi:sec-independent protein translocase protein TatC
MFEEMKPHLVELRERLIKMVISLFVGFIIAWSFHTPILNWMTAPLNNALEEVGKIIESKNASTWKLQNEANSSKKEEKSFQTEMELSKDKTIKSIKKMQESLERASESTKDDNLSKSLKSASLWAKETAQNLDKLINIISKEINLTSSAKNEKSFGGMITTHKVGGAFWVAIKVSFFAGLVLAIPFILWQIWLFIVPAFREDEKRRVVSIIKPFIISGTLMFIVGILFAYYVVTPFGFQFLITFGSFLYTPLINIEDYVGFFGKILFGFGMAFELPVFSYFLAKMGIITDKTLKDYFRNAIVIIFIAAALLTPPDVLTQLLMAGPLVMLYGVSIYIVSLVNPYKEEDEE